MNDGAASDDRKDRHDTPSSAQLIAELEGVKPTMGGDRSDSSIDESRKAAGVSDTAARRAHNLTRGESLRKPSRSDTNSASNR